MIHQIFPSFSSYVVTLVTIGVPLLVLVGYVHWKKSGARKAEVDIGFETDPFRRRTLVNSELLVMMNLKLLKMLVKLSEKKTLTEDELNSIKELDEELSNMTSERSFRNKIDGARKMLEAGFSNKDVEKIYGVEAVNQANFEMEDSYHDPNPLVNEGKKKKEKESPIHKKKWERCVKDVKKKNKENKTDYNPYAVCTASIGYEGSIKKPHRRKEKEELEETTTFSSVFGSGFPITPFMFAKKGKHIPSKKPIWKGGKIVQKVNKADLLGESLLDEINKVKWV